MKEFGWAIKEMRNGEKVCRSGWNGVGMFIFLVPGSTFKVNRAPLLGIYPAGTEINYQPHIDMKTAQGTIVPWVPSQSDVLAVDWELAENNEVPPVHFESNLSEEEEKRFLDAVCDIIHGIDEDE